MRIHRILPAILLLLTLPILADDALREVDRAETLEGSTEIVMARFTGRTGTTTEKQKEGYSCLFRHEEWVFESAIKGSGPWKTGDTLKVFDAGQQQDCWRGHEYKTTGLDIGLILLYYQSPTQLVEQGAKDVRGILLGRKRGAKDFELHCPRSIERPDQADTLRVLSAR